MGSQQNQIGPSGNRHLGHIAIIGGGTAGWMAAATLRRRLGCRVTLIESSTLPTIGVGEATIPSLIDWVENMGIDEDEFLRRTGGTYKLAIRFDNWVTKHHHYWHPFGICGARLDGVDLIHFWQRGLLEGWLDQGTSYTDFSLQRELCKSHRAPRDRDSLRVVSNYAFHLDAGKLAQFLRETAIEDGVVHRVGDVAGATLDSDGAITAVQVTDQPSLVAELYVDCSGFRSVLIEKSLRVKWVDWSSQLLCDRAVVTRADHTDRGVLPYTISTGLSAGWAWQIPLQDNIGVGYVYSSQHASAEEARLELLRHAGLSEEKTTRELSMRIGRREKCWLGNCVAIGLSAGFIEPLESTGIFLVQRALDDLVDCLPVRLYEQAAIEQFNDRMRIAYEEIRDFVLLHYIVSNRDDTSFWREARGVALPDSLETSLASYESLGKFSVPRGEPVFVEANHHFIMSGAGRLPSVVPHRNGQHRAWRYASSDVSYLLSQIRTQNATIALQSVRHREALT